MWKKYLTAICLAVALVTHAQETMRPEVAKALQVAQDAFNAKKLDEAFQKIQDLKAKQNLNDTEKAFTLRLDAVIALRLDKNEHAAQAIEALLLLPNLAPADRPALLESAITANTRLKAYDKVVLLAKRYLEEGGKNPQIRLVMIQSLALQGQHQAVVQEMQTKLKLDAQAGVQADEAQLRMLAFSQQKIKDEAGYVASLKQLVARFPSPDYWSDLLNRLPRQPGFNKRSQLDVYRLALQVQALTEADDFTDAAQTALKAGLPYEALRFLEQGSKQGVFSSPETKDSADKLTKQAQQRGQEDDKQASPQTANAKTGEAFAQLADVALSKALSKAQFAQSAELYQKALSLGGLKYKPQVQLHLGLALLQSGDQAQAQTVWQQIQEDASAQELALLWLAATH